MAASKLSPDQHIATIVVLACALVKARDTRNARAEREVTTSIIAAAGALPAEVVTKLIALVDAPVVELLQVEAPKAEEAKVTNG